MSGSGRTPPVLGAAIILLGAIVSPVLAESTSPSAPGLGSRANSTRTVDSSGDVGRFTSLEFDSIGNPVISYYKATKTNLKLAHCADSKCAMGTTTAVPDNGKVGGYTSLELDGSGNPVISYYYGSLDVPSGDLRVLHCGNADCTAGNTIAIPDSAGDTGVGTALVLDGAGNPVVSYVRIGRGLRVLHCGNADCTAGNVISPVSSFAFATQTSIALDASGHPVVSYFGSDGLRVVHCGDVNCLAGNLTNTPDGDTGSGGWQGGTSLRLDASGDPVVTYFRFDLSDSALRVLHCGNPTCSMGNMIAAPDGTGWVGGSSSLTIDSAGRPVVSYSGEDGTVLSVLRCGNDTCTTGNTIATPDSTGAPGYDSSIQLTGADRPVVSYYEAAGQNLKLLRCSTPTCM